MKNLAKFKFGPLHNKLEASASARPCGLADRLDVPCYICLNFPPSISVYNLPLGFVELFFIMLCERVG